MYGINGRRRRHPLVCEYEQMRHIRRGRVEFTGTAPAYAKNSQNNKIP